MTEPKKVPKKLRGREEPLMLDPQILRWREKLRKQGIILGRHMAKQQEINERQREERTVNTPEKLASKKWF